MGILRRFSSLALLSIAFMCITTSARADFLPWITNGCWNDCDAMSQAELNQMTSGISSGPFDFQKLSDYVSDSHCLECSNNVARINSAVRQYCNQNCGEGSRCQRRCEKVQRKTMTALTNSTQCFNLAVNGRPSGAAIANDFAEILESFIAVGGTGCWFCSIFDTVFMTANVISTNIYVNLRDIFLSILALGAFGWLLWTVFKFMVTIHGPNVGELMTTLFKGLGLVMLISIAMQPTPSFITGLIVDPIALMSSALSQDIIDAQGFKNTDNSTVEFTKYMEGDPCAGEDVNGTVSTGAIQVCQDRPRSDFAGQSLSADVYNQMNCLLRRMSLELIMGIALGCALITASWGAGPFGLPDLRILLVGIILVLVYFFLYVMVPFKLIDLLLRLCFVICLLPVFLVCFAFKGTRGYSKKAFTMFVSCWIGLIALSLFITFAIQLINAVFR